MNEVQFFDMETTAWRFGVDERGEPFAVAADVARTFEYRDAANALRLVDDRDKGTQIVGTPGGDQQMSVIYRDGI